MRCLIKSAKFPDNEEERLKFLQELEILDTPEERAYDDITKLAALICEVPIALVCFVDKDRQWFKSHHGLDATQTPRDFAFCAHAILEDKTLNIPDSQKDERFHDNPLVTSDPNVKFYVGVPLTLDENYRIGTLCVIDNKPRELTKKQIEALEMLGRQVESQLNLRLKIIKANEEKVKKNEMLITKTGELEHRIMIEKTQEVAKIGSWQVDLTTNKCVWSKMTYQIHEIDPNIEIMIDDGINFYVEEHRPIIQKLVTDAINENKKWDAELKIRTKTNKTKWVRATGYPVIENNKIIRLEGTFQDITENKTFQDEMSILNQRLTLALKASNVGVWEWDLITNELIWDKQMIELYGVNEDSFESGYISWEKGVHHEDKKRIEQEIENAIKLIKKFDTEFRVITDSGEIKTIRALAEVFFDDDKNPLKMIGVNWDISEIIQKENLLETAKKSAEEALKTKSTFLANMSHEIRTPLNGILGLTTLALDCDINKEVKNYLENVKSCGDSLLTIINDILDISKIESGKLKFEKITINLRDLIKSTVDLFIPQATEKKIDLLFNISDKVPEEVLGDPVRIRQVLFNLIGNAIKFTKEGSINIFVTSKTLKKQIEEISFEIIDTGIGIEKDNITKLFKNFEQLDSSVSRMYGGTGLGLAICKNLIKMMNGKISVTSEINKGSKFSFSLQLSTQITPLNINIQNKSSLNKTIYNHKILIVDDNKINQLVAGKFLSSLGCSNIDFASDGQSAVEMSKNKSYDIIFMDIQMPIMNGYDATKKIRERINSNCTIAGLSANAFKEDREKAILSGMDDYLQKPVTKIMLKNFLDKVVIEKK